MKIATVRTDETAKIVIRSGIITIYLDDESTTKTGPAVTMDTVEIIPGPRFALTEDLKACICALARHFEQEAEAELMPDFAAQEATDEADKAAGYPISGTLKGQT